MRWLICDQMHEEESKEEAGTRDNLPALDRFQRNQSVPVEYGKLNFAQNTRTKKYTRMHENSENSVFTVGSKNL